MLTCYVTSLLAALAACVQAPPSHSTEIGVHWSPGSAWTHYECDTFKTKASDVVRLGYNSGAAGSIQSAPVDGDHQ